MSRRITRIFLGSIVFLMSALSMQAVGQDIPARPSSQKLVNDFANVMTADQVGALEAKLVAYNDSTSTQIAVITVRTTGNYEISEFGFQILRQWGVGQEDKDNGLVIIAAIDDRKVNIATGYGVEGAVPDITAKHIIEDQIVPNFRDQHYYRGFDEATDMIIAALAGEYKSNRKLKNSLTAGEIFIIAIVIIILIIAFGGGRSGGMLSSRGYKNWSGPIWMNSGGWSSGSGGGGWSGGGGGFGGFGGGSGGGGGASGGW